MYNPSSSKKTKSKITIGIISIVAVLLLVAAGALGVRVWYDNQLEPVSDVSSVMVVEIPSGSSVQEIANILSEKDLIRSSQAFQWYIRNNNLVEEMKAGTYELDPAQSTPEIVTVITGGKVQQKPVTILPGKRLDQIKKDLIEDGFSEKSVNSALNVANYANHPALVYKPSDLDLEGYLFPETFKINQSNTVAQVIELSLDEMAENITPELTAAWQEKGLGVHQAITLASIVEREAGDSSDMDDIAGVFYNRLDLGMRLESDPTYLYAGYKLGVDGNRSTESPYNTYQVAGLPPGPISNMSKDALEAVAYPKNHDYIYFVAGDDGITRFSKTLAEHEEKTAKYCIELCKSY